MFPHKSKFPLRTCVFVRQQALPWRKTIKVNDGSEPPSKYQDKPSKLYFTPNLIILVSSQLCALWLLISWASQTFPPFYVQQGDDFLLTVVCLLCIHLKQLPSNIIAMQAGTCPYRKVTTHHYYCLFWQLMLKLWKLVVSIQSYEWQLTQIMGAFRIIYGDCIWLSEFITALWMYKLRTY